MPNAVLSQHRVSWCWCSGFSHVTDGRLGSPENAVFFQTLSCASLGGVRCCCCCVWSIPLIPKSVPFGCCSIDSTTHIEHDRFNLIDLNNVCYLPLLPSIHKQQVDTQDHGYETGHKVCSLCVVLLFSACPVLAIYLVSEKEEICRKHLEGFYYISGML